MENEVEVSRTLRFWLHMSAVALTAAGVAGLLDNEEGWTDALFEPDYTILYAPPGGPLAKAGFQPGDSVLTVEGIPVVELGMYSRWPKSLSRAPGESLTLAADRDGVLVTGEVVYGERPAGSRKLQLGFLLVGLAFLWAGVWTVHVAPSSLALELAAVGLAAGLALPGPSLGTWNGVRDHVQAAAMVLWLLLLGRLLLLFPRRKARGTGRAATLALFAPWVILLGCLVTELVFHPRFYHTFGVFTGLLMLGYFLLALVALADSWMHIPRGELGPSGMGWLMGGMGLAGAGLGLLLLLSFLPGVTLPGQGWLGLAVLGVPAGMALGVRRHVRGSAPPCPRPRRRPRKPRGEGSHDVSSGQATSNV